MIQNLTTKGVISHQERVCSNLFSQSRGLIFRRKQNLIMVFKQEKKIRLHNFFVFYPIDVLILDKKKEIVEIKRNFKPFTWWNSTRKGRYVLELTFPGAYDLRDKLSFRAEPFK